MQQIENQCRSLISSASPRETACSLQRRALIVGEDGHGIVGGTVFIMVVLFVLVILVVFPFLIGGFNFYS